KRKLWRLYPTKAFWEKNSRKMLRRSWNLSKMDEGSLNSLETAMKENGEYKLKVGEREVTLKSDMVPVKRYTKREGGDPQVRHGSCQEIHKERGRSPSSQTWFLSRDTQREREVT
ncbi:hypothetical protein LSAT2_019668, partial [Lamellibrachia satsuma]